MPVDGLDVFTRRIDVAGPGAPVIVLVHGLGMSGLTFVPLLRELAPHAQAWAPDLPGFGASDKPAHALQLEELAGALNGWLDQTGLEPDCFVGHSLGAQIVAQLALDHPGVVRRAVLVSPTRDPEARTLAAQAWRMAKDVRGEPWALARLAVRDYITATPARMLRTMRDAMDTRVRERARSLDFPVLVVRGERDPVVPVRWSEELVGLLPQGSLAQIEGAPHGSTFTHAAQVAALVLDFVAAGREAEQAH